jgi:LysR family transcriptional regulator, transcriptional activator of the cysJI operon
MLMISSADIEMWAGCEARSKGRHMHLAGERGSGMDRRLAAFVTVVEQEGFSRAAVILHMTQPAVSQQVQALERELGTPLLERSNRYLHLTSAGEIVYDYARQMVDLEERMRHSVSDLTQNTSGPLAIGASLTIGEYVLPRLLAAFHQRFPLVTPTVTIANTQRVAELVSARRLDVGLVEGEVALPQARVQPWLEDALTIVASPTHRLGDHLTIEPQELAAETWIVRESGSGTRAAADDLLARNGLDTVARLEFGSTQMIKEAVEAGMGISLLSRWAIRREVALGMLTELQVVGTPCVRQFASLTLRSRYQTKALAVFLQTLDDLSPTLASAMRVGDA